MEVAFWNAVSKRHLRPSANSAEGMVKIDSQVWKGRDGEHHRFTISALTHYLVWHVALLSLDTRNYRLYSQLNSAVFYFLLTQLNSAREEALKE